jgi:hypothetical protein
LPNLWAAPPRGDANAALPAQASGQFDLKEPYYRQLASWGYQQAAGADDAAAAAAHCGGGQQQGGQQGQQGWQGGQGHKGQQQQC